MEAKLMTLTALLNATLRLACAAIFAALAMASGQPAVAQEDGFAPAAYVNGSVISRYEFKQRVLFMTLLRQPGDVSKASLSALIEDALRRQAAKSLDISVPPEAVQAGMAEFAARVKLPMDELLKALGKGGVEPETLRDFVEAGLLWRSVVRTKFTADTKITDAQIDRAIGAGAASGGEVRVLLSEIVLPTGGAENAMALAQRLKQTASTRATFAMAAQNYSKAASANAGGALGWIGASALPPEVVGRVLALKVGEVTEPIAVQGAVQLYLLRDISLGGGDAVGAQQVEYAQFFAPAGTDLAGVRAGLDTCDDLYDAKRGLPAESVQRVTVLEAGLSPALRAALAGMDPGETIVMPGVAPSLLMLCTRVPQSSIAPSRDDVSTTLLNAKLGQLAAGYMIELKSNAYIRIP